MTQLILCRCRDDGDYDTIAAIQESDTQQIPSLEWVLQMKQGMEELDEGGIYVIFQIDDLTDVLSFTKNKPNDVTWLCEYAFQGGKAQLGEHCG